MELFINGQPRTFSELATKASVAQLIEALAIKADRVAVEQNGQIVPRSEWANSAVERGDRFEIVHFVGGGV